MSYTIRYENEAIASLTHITLYYAEVGGQALAIKILNQIQTAIDNLINMPKKCPISDFSPDIYKLSVPNLPYLVYFFIKDETIVILEILHGAKNQQYLFEKYINA